MLLDSRRIKVDERNDSVDMSKECIICLGMRKLTTRLFTPFIDRL